MQRRPADELYVVVALADDSAGSFAGDREGIDEDVVEICATIDLSTELARASSQPVVG